MKYRFEVDVEYIDVVRFPGESSGIITKVYDVEASDIFEGHEKVRDLVEPKKKNPSCRVEISHPRLKGIVCDHCGGLGTLEVK